MALVNWGWISPEQAAAATRTVNTAANENYEENQKRTLNDIYSKNIDSAGNLNNYKFYTEASAAGLSPDRIKAAADLYNQQQETNKATAINDTLNRMFGYNPTAGGRNGAPIGNPDNQSTAPTATAAPIANTVPNAVSQTAPTAPTNNQLAIPPEPGFASIGAGGNQIPLQTRTSPAYDAQGNQVGTAGAAPYLPGTTPISVVNPLNTQGDRANGVAAPSLSAESANQDNQQFLDMMSNYDNGQVGNIGGQAASEDNPYNLGEGSITASAPTGPDTRSWFQRFQDSYNPANSVAAMGLSGAQGPANTNAPDSSLFDWTVKNDGTNEYRQYNSALSSMLDSYGYKDASSYLKDVYNKTLLENAAPGVNPMAVLEDPKNPGLGLSKMGQQLITAAQMNKQAVGKAESAVLEAKSKLAEFANRYGVQHFDEQNYKLPDGMMLYDKSNRQVASTLLANRQNITDAGAQLNKANTLIDLQQAMPMVARAYGQSFGNQPTEFSLQESYKSAFPDLDKGQITKLVFATIGAIKTGDWVALAHTFDNLNAADPGQMKANLANLLNSAHDINESNIKNYVIDAGSTAAPSVGGIGAVPSSTKPTGTAPYRPAAKSKNSPKKDPLGIR